MTTTTQEITGEEITGKDWFLAEFARVHGGRETPEPAWLRELRQAAIARFAELGFPTPRWEDWRFTNMAPLEKIPFRAAARRIESIGAESRGANLIRPYAFEGSESARVVFINGRYDSELTMLDGLPPGVPGVKVMSLPAALRQDPETIRRYLSQAARANGNPFTALNTALWEDGAFIQIPTGVAIEKPIHLLFMTTGEGEPAAMHPRILIAAGESSQAGIIETYAGTGGNVYFHNAVTEIAAGENSAIGHTKLQHESEYAYHIASIQASLGSNSNFASCSISAGGALARNDIGVMLDGERIEVNLSGLYMAKGRQHVDHHTRLDHARSHGASRQLYKGILDENGSGVFTGRIRVHPDAQKTDAHQSNRNLLLSETASINTQPQLEILADDVRCTHGATVGQLDEDAIFYLRTRGIGVETARGLLTYAFANEVVGTIGFGPLRERLERLIASRYQLQRPVEGQS